MDKNKNIERMENLNNEINLERKRKKMIEKNRELKMEKHNILQALNSLNKEIRNLNVDCEFLENFDKLMDTDEKIKKMMEDNNTPKTGKKGKKYMFRNTAESEKLLADLRVFTFNLI